MLELRSAIWKIECRFLVKIELMLNPPTNMQLLNFKNCISVLFLIMRIWQGKNACKPAVESFWKLFQFLLKISSFKIKSSQRIDLRCFKKLLKALRFFSIPSASFQMNSKEAQIMWKLFKAHIVLRCLDLTKQCATITSLRFKRITLAPFAKLTSYLI